MDDMQKQVMELLEQAMKQPGVADVVRLYESQKGAIAAYDQACQASAPRWIVTSSTSSSQGMH
jgi:hypothetical protein